MKQPIGLSKDLALFLEFIGEKQLTRNQRDENQSPGLPSGFAPTSVNPPLSILQLSSKDHLVCMVVLMHQASHSLLKDVTEAMDDTCTSLSLAALLGTKCHLLEAGQVAQLDSVRGGKNCIIKAASAKGTKQKWCCQI